jgi:hypothetical protein
MATMDHKPDRWVFPMLALRTRRSLTCRQSECACWRRRNSDKGHARLEPGSYARPGSASMFSVGESVNRPIYKAIATWILHNSTSFMI